MTVREWFRVMRAADWERDSGSLLDVVDIITPAGYHDSKNARLPNPPGPEIGPTRQIGPAAWSTPVSYTFWRVWQPMADEAWRAGALLRHMDRILHPTVVTPRMRITIE